MTDNDNPWAIIHSPYRLFRCSNLRAKKIEAIRQVTSANKPKSTINYLFPILLGQEVEPIKSEIANSISLLMQQMLKEYNNVISNDFAKYFRYISLAVSDVQHLSSFENFELLLGIASLNGNGYVREAAIDGLAKANKNWSMLLPFLLARLNDHVENIREKAKIYVDRVLSQCSLEDILDNCRAFTHFDKSLRTQGMNLEQKALRRIRNQASVHFIYLFPNLSTPAYIFILKSLLDEIPRRNDPLIGYVLNQVDPGAQQWFAKATETAVFPNLLLEKMINSQSSFLRQAAIRKITPEIIENFKSNLIVSTYDSTRRVRESARYFVQSNGLINNIRAHYSRLLETLVPPPIGLLSGFMEVAEEKELDKVYTFLNHSNKLVRSAALTIICRLQGIEALDTLVKGLFDKSGDVRRVAAKLIKNSSSYHDDQIRYYLFNGPEYCKQICFSILLSRKNFYALKDILDVINRGENNLTSHAWEALGNWYRRALPSLYSFPDKSLYESILADMEVIEETYKEIPVHMASYWEDVKKTIKAIGHQCP